MNQFYKNVSMLSLFPLGLFAFLVCGCGSDHPTLVPASGTVLFEGKPLTSGKVIFQPKAGRSSIADLQSDGTFSMSTFSEFDGATIGQQMVLVSSTGAVQVDDFGEEYAGKSLIPEFYNNFRTSGIVVEIPPEGTDSIVIELEKKKKR